jgi:hypothetical protein
MLTPSLTQYWVTFAFLTVFESAVSAVYWFRKHLACPDPQTRPI